MSTGDNGPPRQDPLWGETGPVLDDAEDWGDLPEPNAPGDHPFEHSDPSRYERRGELGRGGMGRVVTVLDHCLRREVALKEVAQRAGSTDSAESRLAREAWITAQLEHPGIVPVYNAGRTDDGGLFYTMRLIRGNSLEDLLKEAPLLEERLRLLRSFLDACQALAYAHSLGIVHRDIKPANIMIGEFGETQVVDWGLARPTNTDQSAGWWAQVLPDAHLSTAAPSAAIGTPAYMSPEQAAGEPADERSDVWGLGAVLYELLTGRPPFVGPDSREVLKKLRTRPPPPITEPDAPAELIAIADRALSRDPDDRYADARDMAADVVRYIDGRTVRAYDYTPTDHLRRFLAAWRIPLAVAAAAVLVVGLVGVTGAIRTTQERDRAQTAESQMADALQVADDNLALALVQQSRLAANVGARPEAEILAAHALTLAESPEARGVLAAFDTARPALLSEVDATALPCSEYRYQPTRDGQHVVCLTSAGVAKWQLDTMEEVWSRPLSAQRAYLSEGAGEVVLTGQDFEQVALYLSLQDGSLLREHPFESPLASAVFASSGRFAINAGSERIGSRTGSREKVRLCTESYARAVTALSEDRFAWVCQDGTLHVGALDGPRRSLSLDSDQIDPGAAHQMAVAGSEEWLVLLTHRGEFMLIDLEHMAIVHQVVTGMGTIRAAAFSTDDRVLALAGEHGGVRLWHRASGVWLGQLPARQVHTLRFTDATTLTVLSDTLQQWSIPAQLSPDRVLRSGGFNGTAFSPDGRMLCGATAQGEVRVWPISAGTVADEAVFSQRFSTEFIAKDCDFTADSRHLLAAVIGHRGVPLIRTDDWSQVALLDVPDIKQWPYHRRLGALQGGLIFSTSYRRSGPEVWRLGEEGTLDFLRVPGRRFAEAETNHSRTAAALFDEEGLIYRLSAGEPPSLTQVAEREQGRAIDITDDGRRIAVGMSREVELLDAESGAVLSTLGPTRTGIREISFSVDDRYLAAGQNGGMVHLWEVETGTLVAVLRGHSEKVVSIAFSPDGTTMATASWDGALRLWGLTSLHTPADELVPRFEAAWKLSLEDALSAEVD